MANTGHQDLSYGHFGRPNYHRGDREWQFQRESDHQYFLRPIGEPTIVNRPETSQYDSRHFNSNLFPSRRRDKQVQALVQAHPELQAASDLLPEFARVSEAVEETAAHFDPNKSQLLAFGKVRDEAHKNAFPVAVFPTGPNGCDLLLTKCSIVQRGWHDSKLGYLKVITPATGGIVWSGPGVPIQQIVFASPHEQGLPWILAVRLMNKTLLFKPVLRESATSNASRLDFNLLFEISMDETGGHPHADITFNPCFTRQFAIIDQAGHWSVRELKGRGFESAYLMYRGKHARGRTDLSSSENIWACIRWASKSTKLVLASRHTIDVVGLSSNTIVNESVPQDDLDSPQSWNLDVLTFPDHPAHFATLTTTHITIFHADDEAVDRTPGKRVLHLRHRLNPLDISLSMQCFVNEDGYLLLIYSATTNLIIVYSIRFTPSGNVMISDPSELVLDRKAKSGISGLHIENLRIGGKFDDPDHLAAIYRRTRIPFVGITTLGKDSAITQWICTVKDRNDSRAEVLTPTWEKTSRDPGRLDYLDISDPDIDESDQQQPVSAFLQRLWKETAAVDKSEWTVTAHLVARQLDNVDVEGMTDFDEIIDEARDSIWANGQKSPFTTLRELLPGEVSIHNVESAERQLSELEHMQPHNPSQDLSDHPADSAASAKLCLRNISLPRDIGNSTDLSDISSMYDVLSRNYNAVFLEENLDLTRLSKRQHALRLASEISLAARILRPEVPPTDEQADSQTLPQSHSQNQGQSQDSMSEFRLPLRPSGIPASDPWQGSSRQMASVLPTPSPSVATSAITSSSHPSTLGPTSLFTNLQQYTTFSKPLPSTQARPLQNLQQHWTLGADPKTYNWNLYPRISHSSANIDTAGDEDLSERQAARQQRSLQRRAERFLRRQRKEAEETARMKAVGQQLPHLFHHESQSLAQSSPFRGSYSAFPQSSSRQAMAGSSQQPRRDDRMPAPATQAAASFPESSQSGMGGSSQIPVASQVLPGRHGGRPPVKKKRKSGF